MSRISKILIANRGEIACRVIRTARRMGLGTVAIYSDSDANALHVVGADQAVHIGPAPARESYLVIDRIIQAAKDTGADAIHPGYGFLSENAAFAEAVTAAGLIFIGPPAGAIRAMGGKSEAKALMEKAGVPLVPGYHGADQDADLLAAEAARIGYPVLIKASAGGGGKGMKVAASVGEFPAALASARREAKASFGDDRMLIERYLARPRHVEIQVFADSHGNCVYLFERDCSIQRRHQKVVEEAPAPGMNPAIRTRMGEAAVAAALAIGYIGAGTVEFLLDNDGSFFFMEMNTRLQVEHPVTEMITGQDLVEWQLRVAAGEPLPLLQDQLSIHGHAIEVRLYAEDPAKGFLPQTGTLAHLRFPDAGDHVRVDTGVRGGDAISIHYDPMIAKLIVWDHDRDSAVRRLERALAQTEVAGFNTNVPFLAAVAGHPGFLAADLDTRFIDRYGDDLLPPVRSPDAASLALFSLGMVLSRRSSGTDPWDAVGGFRLNLPASDRLDWREAGEGAATHHVEVTWQRRGFSIAAADHTIRVEGPSLSPDGMLTATLDGTRTVARFVRWGDHVTLFHAGTTRTLMLVDPYAGVHADNGGSGRLAAPMPGKIIAILVEEGASVVKGQPVIVLEAMKMEHTLKAPTDGTITHLRYQIGEQVSEGVELVGLAPAT